jgi:hypothetical protein
MIEKQDAIAAAFENDFAGLAGVDRCAERFRTEPECRGQASA